MRFFASALMICGGFLAAPAMAFTPERAALMVDAVRANGCQMTGDEAPMHLEPLGLNADEVQSFVEILAEAELLSISPDQSTLTLTDVVCAADSETSMALIADAYAEDVAELEPWQPQIDVARGVALVATIRGNDCQMTEAEAEEILPEAGFSRLESREIAGVLLGSGLALVSDENALALAPEFCAAAAENDEAALTDALANWDSDRDEAVLTLETEDGQ